jgi:hypothetical protein
MITLLPKGPNKIIKIFQIEVYFHLPPVSTTPMVNLEPQISPRIKKKIKMAVMVYSGAWEKLIQEKIQSWHCPFKVVVKLPFKYSKVKAKSTSASFPNHAGPVFHTVHICGPCLTRQAATLPLVPGPVQVYIQIFIGSL